jgi:Zn-dependent peptidase ImmA (M78 family)
MTQLAFDFDSPLLDAVSRGHFRDGHYVSSNDLSAVLSRVDEVWNERRLNGTPPSVHPMLGHATRNPGEVAANLRAHLELGDRPVISMVDVLSKLGITVDSTPRELNNVCAFSCWLFEMPIVLLRAHGEGRARVRFDAAHELGHLLMHRDVEGVGQVEEEAQAFARNLLLPRQALCDRNGARLDLATINAVSETFGISRMAVIYAARKYELITSASFKGLIIRASQLGWRNRDSFDSRPPEVVSAASRG